MQGYSYSIFSIVALAIHLIINFDMLMGRGIVSMRGSRYRGFLMGVLFYYVADAAWGVFAGLGWTGALYFDTILFFLSLVVFVFMWCRFVVAYLGLGVWPTRVLAWSGRAILAANVALIAANFFTNCFFHIDGSGRYATDYARDPAIAMLIAYIVLASAFVLAKAAGSRGAERRRSMMVLMFCVTVATSIVLQIIWPLTPFTSLGCLVCNCFFHVFVVQDEQAARHAEELEEALARARAAEKARSMFFSIVSHDIRTPLNAIIGYSELLRHGVGSGAERDEALESIHASGTTLLQLVNDVLDLAKMDAGKMTLHPGPLKLSRLIGEVFSSFRLSAAEKGIALVDRTADVPTVLLDGHRFRQILFNLVGNAVKFTERGSVTVSASCSGADLEVSVSDTGCGIAPDMLTRVLDPFVQVEDPSHAADRVGGTGLGLSICRSLASAMGGELFVESELGKGSKFRVCLSGVVGGVDGGVAAAAPAEERKQPPVEPGKLPRRVLVVDDSPINRAVLSAHMKRAGVAAIDHAGDGEEALAKLRSSARGGSPHDFVFSDIWMPNMNGMEFVEKLRAEPRLARVPVFAVTADTEFRNDKRYGLFDGVLLKPLTYDKLMEAFAASRARR